MSHRGMTPRPRGCKRRRLVLSGVAAAVTWSMLVPGTPVVESSVASWQRAQVAVANVTTLTIPPPRLTRACRYLSILGLGGRVEI